MQKSSILRVPIIQRFSIILEILKMFKMAKLQMEYPFLASVWKSASHGIDFANNRSAQATVEQIKDRRWLDGVRLTEITSPLRIWWLRCADIATFPSTKLLGQISVRAEWLLYQPKPRTIANKKRSCSNIYSRYIGQSDVTCCWFLSFDSKWSVRLSVRRNG